MDYLLNASSKPEDVVEAIVLNLIINGLPSKLKEGTSIRKIKY